MEIVVRGGLGFQLGDNGLYGFLGKICDSRKSRFGRGLVCRGTARIGIGD